VIYCLMLFIIVSGMNSNHQELNEHQEISVNGENEEQFRCESICFKLHPFGIKTMCGHKFCLSCIYKLCENNPSLCAYCRTPLSSYLISDYSFVDVNIKTNLDKIEFEDLQNCFPVLPLIPEITSSDLLRYLSQNKRMNINFVCPLNKGTALLSAAYSGNFDIIKGLVEQGANTDYVNENGESAFVFATKHTLSMIQYFLKLGANINQNGNRGTPLLFATRFGNVEAVEFLIKNKANVNLESLGDNKTPLMTACHYGHFKL